MADRNLVTPTEVIEYTAFAKVKSRQPSQLEMDIIQAEAEIFTWCGHTFSETDYPEIPAEVKLAAIKLTEFFALSNTDTGFVRGYQSESIGNYSYTLSDGEGRHSYFISLGTLIGKYRKVNGGNLIFKMGVL